MHSRPAFFIGSGWNPVRVQRLHEALRLGGHGISALVVRM
jgi:hypothetical protein